MMLLDLVLEVLEDAGVDDAEAVASDILGVIADEAFEGASSRDVRDLLRAVRELGADGPAAVLAGLIGFGNRPERGEGPSARRGRADDDDGGDADPEEDDPDVIVEHELADQ